MKRGIVDPIASVITIACEMRCPWNLRYERAHLVYLVLSREACLAATRDSWRRKRVGPRPMCDIIVLFVGHVI